MPDTRMEYVGFKTEGSAREYTLRVREGAGESYDFRLSIPNEAFLSRRVRYQDAPDVCFLKLQRELTEHVGGLPALCLSVTDSDLEEYRVAHTPAPARRRPKAPAAG